MMRKLILIVFGVFVSLFVFCSCSSSDERVEDFYVKHPTPAAQLNFFVSEAHGDVELIARMLEENISYIDDVRCEAIEPNAELLEKLNVLVSKYCNQGGICKWRYVKAGYGEARWYDWLLMLLVDCFTLGADQFFNLG